MNTPTPGDLSARLRLEVETALRVARNLEDGVERVMTAIAALSALPAAGGHMHVASEDDGDTCAVCGRNFRAHATTQQPSAAEDYESWAKQERQREDTATRLGSAAVGAQGDGITADWVLGYLPVNIEGWKNVPEGYMPGYNDALQLCRDGVRFAFAEHRALAAPAAGKGVDDVLADMRRTTPGDDEHIEALLADYADKIEAALTRQPVATHGPDGSMSIHCQQMGCQNRQPVAGDGMVLVPREQLSSLADILHDNRTTTDSGLPVTVLECIDVAQAAATEIRQLLAAAPAATTTDS